MPELFSTETGQPLCRNTRPVVVRYRDLSMSVDVEGRFGEDEGDGVLALGDSRAIDRALNKLKANAHSLASADEVRRIRKKLKMTQKQASALLGGGANAFAKYENGDVIVSQSMSNLLRLLDAEPKLLKTLRMRDQAA